MNQQEGDPPDMDPYSSYTTPDDPAEARSQEILGHPESQEYLAEMYARLRRFADRAEALGKEDIDFLQGKDVGMYWWRARADLQISRYQVAESIGTSVNNVRLLEVGLGEETELNPSFLNKYAAALGKPELYQEYEQRFNPPQPPQP